MQVESSDEFSEMPKQECNDIDELERPHIRHHSLGVRQRPFDSAAQVKRIRRIAAENARVALLGILYRNQSMTLLK